MVDIIENGIEQIKQAVGEMNSVTQFPSRLLSVVDTGLGQITAR